MMQGFLKAIPDAAASPYALAAYGVAAVLFLLAGSKLQKTKALARYVDRLPKSERRRGLEIAAGTILPDSITPEDWLRLKRMQGVILLLGSVVIAGLVVAIIAIVTPSTVGSEEVQNLGDAIRYRPYNVADFRVSTDLELRRDSPRVRSGLGFVSQQLQGALQSLDPNSDILPNGLAVRRRARVDDPPRLEHVLVPLSSTETIGASFQSMLANLRLRISLLGELPPDDAVLNLLQDTSQRRVRFTALDGERKLLFGLSGQKDLLALSEMRIDSRTASVREPLNSLLDLAGLALVIEIVPWADNDVDYEYLLQSPPARIATDVVIRASDRYTLRIPFSELKPLHHDEELVPQMYWIRFPRGRAELIRWLEG